MTKLSVSAVVWNLWCHRMYSREGFKKHTIDIAIFAAQEGFETESTLPIGQLVNFWPCIRLKSQDDTFHVD